ncbi:MAG: hypothetical protein ACM34K_17770 [Bacillota bacterium]
MSGEKEIEYNESLAETKESQRFLSSIGITEDYYRELLDEIKTNLSDPKITEPQDPLVKQQVKDIKTNRELKRKYARYFVRILVGQLLIMNIVFILYGSKVLYYDGYSLNLYMGGTLAEVFGVVLIITKHLFPAPLKK